MRQPRGVFPASIKDSPPRRRRGGTSYFPRLEHVPEKLTDFFASDMLHLFESEQFLFDQMIPSDREALSRLAGFDHG